MPASVPPPVALVYAPHSSDQRLRYIDALLSSLDYLSKPLSSDSSPSSGQVIYTLDSSELSLPTAAAVRKVFLWFEDDGEEVPGRKACEYTLPLLHSLASNREGMTSDAKRLKALLGLITGSTARADITLEAGEWSHFLSLTYPDLALALPVLPSLRKGTDAFEVRVDLLKDQSPRAVHHNLAVLREACPLPIVFTVRTAGQIGKFPDDAVPQIQALLEEGLRAGVEWLDVEACLPAEVVRSIAGKVKDHPEAVSSYSCTTRLLGSLHITTPQTEPQVEDMFRQCDLLGYADVLKVVTGAKNDEDCRLVHAAGARQKKPYIGLCLGAAGQLSRVLNRRFTPVTHELMAAAAPGQLTVAQLMQRRQALALITPKEFHLFGTPIAHSLSPRMHNGGYDALLLPHHYSLKEETDVNNYKSVLASEAFGGASVTIPHKESIMPMVDEVVGAANIIGAVNTLVPTPKDPSGAGTRLLGYNTDWLGMLKPLRALLKRKGTSSSGSGSDSSASGGQKWGLVVGAGGTARAACYTIQQLGKAGVKGPELATSISPDS